MFDQIRKAISLHILKWKFGEYTALGTVCPHAQDRLLPIFVMPPAGDFDPETGRKLGPLEHLKTFGSRLYSNWGKRPAFIDAAHVDNDEYKRGLSVHPLTELLERARIEGGIACPVTGLGRSPEYQNAVKRFVSRNPELPICVRLGMEHLDSRALRRELVQLQSQLSCPPEKSLLILDVGPADLREYEAFAELLADQVINELPFLHDWLNICVALTSFPEQIKLKAKQHQFHARDDIKVYANLISTEHHLLRRPIFGDYALEYPSYKPVGRVTPSAQLRYSIEPSYLIEKGLNTRKPNGYEAIFAVAQSLVARPEFMGATFSRGDAYIAQLAAKVGTPGNAPMWRWAATDHHLTLVHETLCTLLGIKDTQPAELPPSQALLFRG